MCCVFFGGVSSVIVSCPFSRDAAAEQDSGGSEKNGETDDDDSANRPTSNVCVKGYYRVLMCLAVIRYQVRLCDEVTYLFPIWRIR